MALQSSMMPLGTIAPNFSLSNVVSGEIYPLTDHTSKVATVIMFICNHCPYVKHIQTGLIKISKDYQSKGITFIAINSNDPIAYPDDSPENMKKVASEFGYPFPYLFDETQEVAKSYQAVCTPDFFVFDYELKCVYRGQFDDSRPGNEIPVTGHSLREALDAILSGKNINKNQKPSIGCGIKWKIGD